MTLRIAMRCVALLLLLVFALCIVPSRAYALYNDVAPDSKYSASQDVSVSGDPISGDVVPDGDYAIDVSTSSTMCQPVNCILFARDGSLYAGFDLTGAYTAIYFGSAEEAAAQTDEAGVAADAYYVSDPPEGYVTHYFVLPIPALNVAIDVATYTGGKNFEAGMWYSRKFCFNSSSDVEQAIWGGGEDVTPPDDEPLPDDNPDNIDPEPEYVPSDEPSGDEGGDNDGYDDGDSDGSDDSSDDAREAAGNQSTDENDDTDESSATENSESETSDIGDDEGEATGQVAAETQEDAEAEESAQAAESSSKSSKIKARGISFVQDSGANGFDPSQIDPADITIIEKKDLTPYIVGVTLFVLFDLGLIGAFLLGLRRARPRVRIVY